MKAYRYAKLITLVPFCFQMSRKIGRIAYDQIQNLLEWAKSWIRSMNCQPSIKLTSGKNSHRLNGLACFTSSTRFNFASENRLPPASGQLFSPCYRYPKYGLAVTSANAPKSTASVLIFIANRVLDLIRKLLKLKPAIPIRSCFVKKASG